MTKQEKTYQKHLITLIEKTIENDKRSCDTFKDYKETHGVCHDIYVKTEERYLTLSSVLLALKGDDEILTILANHHRG